MFGIRIRTIILLSLIVFNIRLGVYAQSLGGAIRGRVQDASGAIIVGARVSAKNVDRGLAYETTSDSLGIYQIAVPVGPYELLVEAPNFAGRKETGLHVSVAQTLAMDVTLQVRGASEQIEVRAEPPLLETTSGTISAVVDRDRLADLPLNGRDFGSLALLQPGVVPNNTGAVNTPFGGKWANFLVNGQIDQATLFLLDGSDINDLFSGRTPGGSNGLLLGLESVHEFRLLLNSYKAEYGRASGGVIHVVSRSGSNRFHGAFYEYLRNSALDAKNFFDSPDRKSVV